MGGRSGDVFSEAAGLLAQKAQQPAVHFFRMRPCNAVRTIFHDQLARSFDEPGSGNAGGRDGENTVGIPLNHQRGHVDARQVFAEVFVPGCDACQAGGGGGAGCDVPVGLNRPLADALAQELVAVVEILEEAGEECLSIGGHGFFDPGKHAAVYAVRVVGYLEQIRRHPGDNHCFAHIAGSVFA
jgi:hypothetical protein